MEVRDRNEGKPGRKPNPYLRYYVKGKRYEEPAKRGVKALAAQQADIRRQIKLGTWLPPSKRKPATLLFADYARQVIQRRTDKGVGKNESPPNKTERAHVERHLIPAFGKLTLPELTNFQLVRDGFDGKVDDAPEVRATRINHKGLGGRSVRNIHSTLRTIFWYATDDGLIDEPPQPLQVRRDHMPAPRDKDPNWRRDHAKFSKREVVTIATCEEVETLFRALLVTYFYTGPRFNELHKQRVSDYDRDLSPLCGLTVLASKLGRHAVEGQVRHVPVHPELQAWLDWWLDEEWPFLYGRKPRKDDLLFPTLSVRQLNKKILFINYQEFAYKFREVIIPKVGLQTGYKPPPGSRRRERGIHCARATFIGLMRSARVDDKLLRAMTHQGTGQRVLDMYTQWEWEALCGEVSRISLGLPPPPYRNKPPIRLVQPGARDATSDAVSETSRFTGRKKR